MRGLALRSARRSRGCARGSSRRRHRSPRRSAARAARASRSRPTASLPSSRVLGGKNSKLTPRCRRATSANSGASIVERGSGHRGSCAASRCRSRPAGLRASQSFTVNSPPSSCSTASASSPASSNHAAICSSAKPSRAWASLVAQFLALVRGEIDDQQAPAGREQPRRLGDRRAPGCCAKCST